MPIDIRPDVVVVGGGTAGCVVAARLSEDPARSVLLLEAGPATLPHPEDLVDARLIPGARGQAGWSFPGQIAEDRSWTHVRGRVLGGSSTTNGGYFIPAGPADAAAWERHGGPRWSWNAVRGAQMAIESDLDMPDSAAHGHSGPMPISRPDGRDPRIEGFLAAATALGHRADIDKGADWTDGAGLTPSNRRGCERVNTAAAYLAPALTRPNLRVVGGASVRQVKMRGARATGVIAEADGQLVEVDAGEVVLTAGALRTPDLLALSGVHMPGLGEGLHDDPQVLLEVRGWTNGVLPASKTWSGGVLHITMADGSSTEILQSLQPLAQLAGRSHDEDAPLPLFVSSSAREPSGRLHRVDDDPRQPPRVVFDHLRDARARAQLRASVRAGAELVYAGGGDLLSIDRDTLRADGPLDAWIRGHLGTAFHTTGGAAIGPVVDGRGRVHGVNGLRVADLSLLPAGLRRGPAATAVLIGEMLADVF